MSEREKGRNKYRAVSPTKLSLVLMILSLMCFISGFYFWLFFPIHIFFWIIIFRFCLSRVRPSLAWSEPGRPSTGWKPFWTVNSTILNHPKVCGISWILPTSSKTESLFASKFFFPLLFLREAFVESAECGRAWRESYPPIHQVSYDRAKEKPPDSAESWRRRVTHLSLSVHQPSVTKKTCRLAGEWRLASRHV